MTSMKGRQCDDRSEKSSADGTTSTAQVQELISREVQSALEQSDKMMKALMEKIQEVESEPRYDTRLRKLEAHIRKVKRRGDAVFADLRKRRSLDVAQDQNFMPTPEIKKQAKSRTRLFPFAVCSANGGISGSSTSEGQMSHLTAPAERTKNQIVDLTDDGEEFVPLCELSARLSLAPEIPRPVMMKKKTPEVQEAEASLLSRLPPFPHTPFPHQLPVAAASKSMPQKPVVKVAAIKNPQGIALLWNVEEEDPDAAAMDCYYIYVTQQRSDGTFSKWKTMGVIKAMPLPMACRVAAERSRDKTLCFLIIGKDVYGRYGPYSDVHIVWAGEM
ncbi:hypothetical protein QTP70_023294 [Hemibagrus guttatus]|uniref:Activating transcription factor 7-interacting protein Fn3 domain-containing protein n=1 Tax=Hemibagrus guttatus TaxID=175788 RepID=A0AAE0QGW7_9TELE|nr:hypothetical protein QTP70_023294 [Hemibagrus guttatus]